MTSTTVLSRHPMPSPHLSSSALAPPASSFSAGVVIEDVQHPTVALASPPTASTASPASTASASQAAARKRPRGKGILPPPIIIPPRPPTSLPSEFYAASADAPPRGPKSPAPPVWNGGARSATSTRRGVRRRQNEDRVFAYAPARVFGVCDGHGGEEVAHLVATRFPQLMAEGCSLTDAFAAVEREACAKLQKQQLYVGTTLTVVEVTPRRRLKVAHVGDSRAMLIDGAGRPSTLTRDHSPDRPDEQRRIEAARGGVFNGRVNGILAVSRAIGDLGLKAVVSAEPELMDCALNGDDQLIVLASDGLWDVITDQEVAKFLRGLPLETDSTAVPVDLQGAARSLVKLAVERGSKDDTSVVLVDAR